MRFNLFYDPRYNAESYIEFEPEDVVSVQETTKNLFLGGQHRVTIITLKSGAQHILQGEHATTILDVQRALKK